ncbi:MAG: cytochrome c [Candidatus Rokubacteria bacterium]|nr:cytochrome c [Candidatus Rokubacteria bacterium]
MMKYVFLLVLLIVGGAGLVHGGLLVMRWNDNMTQTPRVMPGQQVFAMPAGTLPRSGGQLLYSKEEREVAATRRNPVPATPESITQGASLWAIYCTPCHGDGGKGDGLVTPLFAPPPDLTNPDLQKVRTDGYWESYLSVGGVLMPAYGEALSVHERWVLVNYVRSLAAR